MGIFKVLKTNRDYPYPQNQFVRWQKFRDIHIIEKEEEQDAYAW